MAPEEIDMDTGVRLFLEEMEKGLSADGASLRMLPTYIRPEGDIPLHTPVLVLDAGGTNFRVARVSFTSPGEGKIESFKKMPMPGIRGVVDRRTFFHTIAEHMAGHLEAWTEKEAPTVGFCFSYPTTITPEGDGRLLHFTKEVKAPEVEGELIGASLIEALKEKGFLIPRRIVLLNDTVATLLAGKVSRTAMNYDGYIGFILGTGTNCAYVEENSRIVKLSSSWLGSSAEGSQVINIESGGMNRIPAGAVDDMFDADTENPGSYRFEKMVSGAYLGPLGGRVLSEAAKAGVFSQGAAAAPERLQHIDTVMLDGFLHEPMNQDNPIAASFSEEEDRSAAYALLDAVVDRAAKLAAINLAATALREGGGKDPVRPIAICADGTTFFKTKDLHFRTRHYLQSYLREEKNIHFEILHREDAPIIGSAVAALIS
jgi:hexokinase